MLRIATQPLGWCHVRQRSRSMTDTVTAVRLSRALVEFARREGLAQSRSIAGQVEHWARLGMALEAAPPVQKAALDALLVAGQERLERDGTSSDFTSAARQAPRGPG